MAETWRIIHARGVMRAEVSLAMSTGHLAALSEWHGWRAVRIDAGELAIAAPEAMGDSAEEACARLAQEQRDALGEHHDGEATTAHWIDGHERGARLCSDALRTIPVPPCPEVSR